MKITKLNLNMKSNNSNGYTVTSSGVLNNNTNYTEYHMFDGIVPSTQNPCFHSPGGSGDKYVLLKLPNKKIITKLVYHTRAAGYWYKLKTFKTYGSIDKTSFDLLASVDASGWVGDSAYTINLNNKKEYLYYKFVINSSSYATCTELDLFEDASGYIISTKDKYINSKTEFNKDTQNIYNDVNNFNLLNELPISKINENCKIIKVL